MPVIGARSGMWWVGMDELVGGGCGVFGIGMRRAGAMKKEIVSSCVDR